MTRPVTRSVKTPPVTVVGGYPGFSTECVQDWHRECIYVRCSCDCHRFCAPITARQREILRTVEAHVRRHGYAPSLREVAATVGLRSPDTVAYHLRVLVARGLLTKGAGKARAIGVPASDVPARCDRAGGAR